MKLYLIILASVLFTSNLNIKAVAKPKKYLIEREDEAFIQEGLPVGRDGVLFEGDMVLSKEQKEWLKKGVITEMDIDPSITNRNAIRDPNKRWPNGIIYYSFDYTINSQQKHQVRTTLSNLQTKLSSCVKFEERNSGNRVSVGSGEPGCWSEVGYLSKIQSLNLGTGCWANKIIEHEFLHSVGIEHTQSRSDRDSYIKILWDNIISKYKYAFEKYDEARITHYGLPYDYYSVMHYFGTAFTSNGKNTIETLDPSMQDVIGSAAGVSSGDIKLIHHMYKCVQTETTAEMKDPAAVKAVAQGNAEFGQRMYEKVKEEDGSNLLMSPYSVSSVMAMVSVGARKKTLEQIMKGMHFPKMNQLLSGYSDVTKLTQRNENFTLDTANKLFVMENFQLLEDFEWTLKKDFQAEINQTNFAENGSEISRKLINDWVEEKTNKKITNLIPEGILGSLTRIVLCNAIYFKGDWASKFNSSKTQDEPFHVKEGEAVKVQMMRKSMEKFKMTYIKELNSEAIEIPYTGDRISMYIILPMDTFGLQDMEKNLIKMDLLKVFEKIDEAKTMNLTLSLPKFTLEKSIDLRGILENLGMDQMFTDKGDFSGMAETGNLSVSDAFQKAFIEVNEDGSEASAATDIVIEAEFICDHPFIFFIRDKETNMVLFSGRVMNPTLG